MIIIQLQYKSQNIHFAIGKKTDNDLLIIP
jgi:hypothetical protein